ncbi:hypothetical protein CEXT_798771 [Caerostris extrusa]|uniref:Uncharacterized protein n=1 Tax=Caerostris extrusa TaxID=172846 RepID=A0AAV4MA26_CAEEX|nr:hypothetical protein CEXT_798771 [Caerostris extrusa]
MEICTIFKFIFCQLRNFQDACVAYPKYKFWNLFLRNVLIEIINSPLFVASGKFVPSSSNSMNGFSDSPCSSITKTMDGAHGFEMC